jgi:hypothetical protein
MKKWDDDALSPNGSFFHAPSLYQQSDGKIGKTPAEKSR